MKTPFVVWLFGLPSAGKTTLAWAIWERLAAEGHPSLRIDGDELRSGLCCGLGFSDADRSENLRRAAEVAALSARSGVSSVVAMISPLAVQRAVIAEIPDGQRLIWAWVDCPVEECRRRDVKGLYRRQQEGAVSGLTGVDGAFDEPAPDVLRIPTGEMPVEEAVDTVWRAL